MRQGSHSACLPRLARVLVSSVENVFVFHAHGGTAAGSPERWVLLRLPIYRGGEQLSCKNPHSRDSSPSEWVLHGGCAHGTREKPGGARPEQQWPLGEPEHDGLTLPPPSGPSPHVSRPSLPPLLRAEWRLACTLNCWPISSRTAQ